MEKVQLFTLEVPVDEETIQKRIVQAAENQLIEAVGGELFEKVSYYGRSKRLSERMMNKLADCIKEFIKENKDYIIQQVVKNVSDRIINSKAMKDALKGETNG